MIVIYLHGFLSSPKSFKAVQTEKWLREHRPDYRFICPFLNSNPTKAVVQLDELAVEIKGKTVAYIGSSLGGFWSTYMVEKYGGSACLVNPAVNPQNRVKEFVGQKLKNYHTDDTCVLSDDDLHCLEACTVARLSVKKYRVLLQTEDEVLDYRLAEEYYKNCQLVIENGGSHGFNGYLDHMPSIIKFLEKSSV